MRTELLRSAAPGRYTLILEGDANDITSLLAVMRAGGDCTIGEMIGKENAKNPKHVKILRNCLHNLFDGLIPVAEKFQRYLEQK